MLRIVNCLDVFGGYLLSNAVKFTPAGEAAVTAEPAAEPASDPAVRATH